MNKQNQKSYSLVEYPIIAAAVNEDVEAINAVLKHYEGYIAALSSKVIDTGYYLVVVKCL